MNEPLARFADIAWDEVAPGAREKRVDVVGAAMRIVEFAPGFTERVWCQKTHVGYVIDGEFSIQFRDTVVRYQKGDGIYINSGVESEHKAVVNEVVTLFLVESGEEQ